MGSSRNPETTTTILEIKLTIIGNFFISEDQFVYFSSWICLVKRAFALQIELHRLACSVESVYFFCGLWNIPLRLRSPERLF